MFVRPSPDAAEKRGWGGRIRTSEYGSQSPAPYRLATPHRRFGREPRVPRLSESRCCAGFRRRTREAQPQGAARKGSPQKVKSSPFYGLLATGRARRSYSARVSVRVSSALLPPFDSGRMQRAAAALLRNRPKTADPLPDIAEATAPASRSDDLSVVISG